jgi:hypothetical protein
VRDLIDDAPDSFLKSLPRIGRLKPVSAAETGSGRLCFTGYDLFTALGLEDVNGRVVYQPAAGIPAETPWPE